MKDFEKFIFLSVIIFLIFSLVGCGNESIENTLPDKTKSQNNDSKYEKIQTIDETQDAPEGFVLIKGGTFEMESPESESWRGKDETQHTVTVSDFYISPYEVTQK